MRAALLLLALLIHQAPAQAVEVVLQCRADLSPMAPGPMTVQITKEEQGRLQSQVNGKLTNQNVRADDYPVRDNLNLRTDPYSPEARALNPAENSLVHLQSLLDHESLREYLKIPFELAQVRKMRIYDLLGYTDKFGGTVLMEAYDREGRLLGRVFRSLFANGCY